MSKPLYVPKEKAAEFELKSGLRPLPTMQDESGVPDEHLDNPYWFNAQTGVLIQTAQHHSRQFAIFPEMVGFTHKDLARLPFDKQSDFVSWAIGYTNLMLASGWVRIDVTTLGEIAIWAGAVDWAEAALQCAVELTDASPNRLTVSLWADNDSYSTADSRQVIRLAGEDLSLALAWGLGRWARRHFNDKRWERSTYGIVPHQASSKMMRAGNGDPTRDLAPEVISEILSAHGQQKRTEQRGKCPFGHSA